MKHLEKKTGLTLAKSRAMFDMGLTPDEIEKLEDFVRGNVLERIEMNEELDSIRGMAMKINREQCKIDCESYINDMDRCCSNHKKIF